MSWYNRQFKRWKTDVVTPGKAGDDEKCRRTSSTTRD